MRNGKVSISTAAPIRKPSGVGNSSSLPRFENLFLMSRTPLLKSDFILPPIMSTILDQIAVGWNRLWRSSGRVNLVYTNEVERIHAFDWNRDAFQSNAIRSRFGVV